jgi:hypothetical protein
MPVSEIKTFQGEAALPYLLDEVEGADVIIVSFPGYRTGGSEPALWQRDTSAKYKVHRLLLGADEHSYWGPAGELRGVRTAVALLEEFTTNLDVAPERVVCVGSSNAASLAAMVGLAYGAGLLILGAPAFAMGTLLTNWAAHERRTGGKPMTSAVRLLELGRRDGEPDSVEWLDRLIESLALECPHPCTVRLLASPDDFGYPGAERLFEQRASFPNVEVELELTDAPTHDAVAKEFYIDFLPRVLVERFVATADSA